MKYYRVYIDFKNYIPIDETELPKALGAMAANGKVFFNEGATDRIHSILPDYHRMMGFNADYVLQPEDHGLIASNTNCRAAKKLLADTTAQLAGRAPLPKELSGDLKQLARKMTEPTFDH